MRTKIDFAREWVAMGLDVNARTNPGPAGHSNFTPTHLAAMHNNAALVLCFHELGADLTLSLAASFLGGRRLATQALEPGQDASGCRARGQRAAERLPAAQARALAGGAH